MSDAAKGAGKGSAPGKGGPPQKGVPKAGGKGLSYKERKEAEARETEDKFSAEKGFSGKELTMEEAAIIHEKGTEEQGTGEYVGFQPQRGYFACRKCGKAIYSCQAKFESGCGWPAFDKCYRGSIVTRLEDDGTDRIEITCAGCGGHLGHVFVEPNTHARVRSDQRHCANSLALQYVKHDPPEGVLEEAVLELPLGKPTSGTPDQEVDPLASRGLQGPALLLETRGDGTTLPKPGDQVTIHYTGTLLTGGVQFDTSQDSDPFEFRVGSGGVIQGWDQGVQQMPLGSRGLLIVPAALAYGERGMPGVIPPHADLVFELELLSINGQQLPENPSPHELTPGGFLHHHLTPILKPAVTSLLRERPTAPCRYLLQHLGPGLRAPASASVPTATGTAQDYASQFQPLLKEMSMAALGCSEQPDQVLPALVAWLKQNEERALGTVTHQ